MNYLRKHGFSFTKTLYFKYIILYITAFIFFTFFRLLFFFSTKHFTDINENYANILRAFVKGLQFDSVVISYGMSLALVFIFLYNILKKSIYLHLLKSWLWLYFGVCFFFLAASSPYFNYNFSHITIAMFNWIDTPAMMIKQVITDLKYVAYFVIYIFTMFIYVYIVKRILSKTELYTVKLIYNILIFIILLALTFLGMRGRISAPLKESNATICENPYINQIPFNSVFTLVKSIDYSISFIDNEKALELTKMYLKVNSDDISINRKYIYKEDSIKPNIVIILMESMTICNMGISRTPSLTPFLDSLSKKSIFFTNVWSAGKHTSNGIFSTLYGYPAIWSRRATSTSNKTSYCGLPGTLKKLGYFNIFFTTHDLSFDNLSEFLPMNNFDSAISSLNYHQSEIVGMYGVPDHIMFKKGVKILKEISNKPFLAVFLTSSNHGPYVIPKNIDFIPTSNILEQQIIEYADWAIKEFFRYAYNEKWFENTIFVLTADHGFIVKKEDTYIPLCLHKIPLIIYSSKYLDSAYVYNQLTSQMDVFPIIMGLIKKSYTNSTFGINVLEEIRHYVFYSDDNKLICLNDTFMFVYDKSKNEKLFKFDNPSKNVIDNYSSVALKMKEYMLSQLQVAIMFSDSRNTKCPE